MGVDSNVSKLVLGPPISAVSQMVLNINNNSRIEGRSHADVSDERRHVSFECIFIWD